jgi:hypothetical protein
MSSNNSKTAGHKAGTASNTDHSEAIECYSTGKRQTWQSFTDAELIRAVELMVAPSDLAIRGAALAILKVFSYTPAEIREQLASGDYFNVGAAFDGLATDTPRIIYPEA